MLENGLAFYFSPSLLVGGTGAGWACESAKKCNGEKQMKLFHSQGRAQYCSAASVALIAVSLAASSAAAQDAAPAALDEIVVTARKVTENLQDVPVAVTALSGDQLQKRNAVTVLDVGRSTPGLLLRQSSTNPSGLLVQMRGQFQRESVASADPSVGTYVDGVYWARSYGLNADLLDLQHVQVLKGPQGTLFGRNTTGGAILLQTNDPQYDRLSGMASGLYGRFNERTFTGVINVPLATDRVAIRAALQINKRDGYIEDYVTGRKYDNRDTVTGRMKIALKPTDDLSIVVSAERYKFQQAGQARSTFLMAPVTDSRNGMAIYTSERGPMGGLTAAHFVAFQSQNKSTTSANADSIKAQGPLGAIVPESRYDTETYSATATLDTGLGAFKLIGAYRGIEGHNAIDLDGSPWNVYTTGSMQDLKQFSAELQLAGKAGDDFDYVGGGFWFKEDGTDIARSEAYTGGQNSASAFVRSSAATLTIAGADLVNKSAGAYAQATWHVTDQWNLTGGLRYSADERGVSMQNRNVNPLTLVLINCQLASVGAVPTGNTCSPVGRRDDFKNWSYLASSDYRITEDIMVYGRFSKGYRSGGQNIRAASLAQFVPFGPEIIYDAEVGLKSEFLDRRLRLNLAGYRSTINGAQRSTRVQPPGGGPNVTILGNAAKVRVWGFEGQSTAIITDGLQASASAAYTKPKYLKYVDLTGDRRGERFNAVPKWQASFALDYTRDIGSAELSLHGDYSWSSKTPLDETNNPTDPLYAQFIKVTTRQASGEASVRGALSFRNGQYELAAFGRNILNNRARTSAISLIGFGFVAGQYQEPATYGVQAIYRFGQ